ncbi:putative nucleoredoxin 3-like isoform X1 [Hibiscus syriacus]|uniref:non-specific serine/threonine protein kinase n=1 Tax=Hibiscus syriacus TaxID=106335 RepID=A0A6A2YVS8_HIBSY|nr:putative nucleoredoxin 3-like isoform X1 [Hibiscus syriacus]
MDCTKPCYFLFPLLFTLACFMGPTWCQTEAQILLKFKTSLTNYDSQLDDWNALGPGPCTGNNPNRTGIRCSNGSVFGIKLENMGLEGVIDIDTLKVLQLTSDRMKALQKVFLGWNNFSGSIPKSLATLPKLVVLSLEWNHFEGRIPDFKQNNLSLVNLAHNNLYGNNLCGNPLAECRSSRRKRTIIIISVVACSLVIIALIAAVHYVLKDPTIASQFKEPENKKPGNNVTVGKISEDKSANHYKKSGGNAWLHFVRNERERFELQDLLRASAEVLGSGSFGSSYKAVISDGRAMVVKRLKQMYKVGKEEFREHMARLGRLSHPNVLSLVAFYYRREEKLLVSDFAPNGSLASYLHSRRAPGQPGLDWPTRLKIIKGVTKGLAYLYNELSNLTLPHGHLKSSNVLLDHTFEPLLADYGLIPVVNKDHAHQFMVAYKSLEFSQHDRTTRKTDVWSLGILILELLTGKFSANYLKQGKGGNADLATWVKSVVREEWTGEVFDKDMTGTRNGEGEMLKLLKIRMCCCEWNMENRWELKEALEKIEELKERESDNAEDYSSYGSEGEVYTSRAITEEDFSFSVQG